MQRSCQSTSNNSLGMIFQYTYMSHYLRLSSLCLITSLTGLQMARQKMAIIMVWSAFLAFFSIIVYYNWLIGIDLARLADLPLDVLVESRRVAERLTVLQTRQEESSESRKIAIRRKALLRVIPSSVTSCVYACTNFVFVCAATQSTRICFCSF